MVSSALLRDEPEVVAKKVRGMATDPARVRRTDPGNPEKCPVWDFHKVYSDEATQSWAAQGCRSAGIGCLDCKQPVIDAILAEQAPMRERARRYLDDPAEVRRRIGVAAQQATVDGLRIVSLFDLQNAR